MAKILIVDDDPDMVTITGTHLKNAGYQVVAAHNRISGMEAVEKENPDLILLDVMMDSEDDGITMAQDLRRKGVKTPIIMLTNVSRISGLEFGRDDEILPVEEFLQKPIDGEDLVKMVEKLLK